jgi:hypothetical protein
MPKRLCFRLSNSKVFCCFCYFYTADGSQVSSLRNLIEFPGDFAAFYSKPRIQPSTTSSDIVSLGGSSSNNNNNINITNMISKGSGGGDGDALVELLQSSYYNAYGDVLRYCALQEAQPPSSSSSSSSSALQPLSVGDASPGVPITGTGNSEAADGIAMKIVHSDEEPVELIRGESKEHENCNKTASVNQPDASLLPPQKPAPECGGCGLDAAHLMSQGGLCITCDNGLSSTKNPVLQLHRVSGSSATGDNDGCSALSFASYSFSDLLFRPYFADVEAKQGTFAGVLRTDSFNVIMNGFQTCVYIRFMCFCFCF